MLFFPLPNSYGVAQLDIEATLRSLCPDAEALSAAQKLRPLKCVVFLQNVRELPLPWKSDYKYTVFVVGPGLRPVNSELQIPADMCIPILPATYHPDNGRVPLASVPEFPFPNCYHWFGLDTRLDVRIKKGVYDPSEGRITYALPSGEYVRMEVIRSQDINRVWEARQPVEPLDEVSVEEPSPESSEPEDDNWICDDVDENSDDERSVSVYFEDEDDDDDDDEDYEDDDDEDECPEEMPPSDILGWDHDPERDAVPVVDFWLDLPAYVDGDEIPDPMAFVQECNRLSQIVRELKERQMTAEHETLPVPAVDVPDSPGPEVQQQPRRPDGSAIVAELTRIVGLVKDVASTLFKPRK